MVEAVGGAALARLRDLDGVRYLFLRGMLGPAGSAERGGGLGVFSWRPPGGMVAALSAFFSLLGLLLSSIGIFGVASYTSTPALRSNSRKRE